MSKTNYVCTLTDEQAGQLKDILVEQYWEIDQVPYSHWRARKNKTTATAYTSGKCSIQGKLTGELVQYILEPLILKEVRFGYESELAVAENPEMFEPHAGIDESGKGDYFGPLVISAVYVDKSSAQKLLDAGVQDSKAIRNSKRIMALAKIIRTTTKGRFSTVTIGMDAYNRMYEKMKNINQVLAWGHARALENLLEKQPDCPRAISDQFGRKSTVIKALLSRGKKIKLEQMHKAESDVAVAAASILARDEFLRRMALLSDVAGVTLPKGASKAVEVCAVKIVAEQGSSALQKFAKLHFCTTDRVLGRAVDAPINVARDGVLTE